MVYETNEILENDLKYENISGNYVLCCKQWRKADGAWYTAHVLQVCIIFSFHRFHTVRKIQFMYSQK